MYCTLMKMTEKGLVKEMTHEYFNEFFFDNITNELN